MWLKFCKIVPTLYRYALLQTIDKLGWLTSLQLPCVPFDDGPLHADCSTGHRTQNISSVCWRTRISSLSFSVDSPYRRIDGGPGIICLAKAKIRDYCRTSRQETRWQLAAWRPGWWSLRGHEPHHTLLHTCGRGGQGGCRWAVGRVNPCESAFISDEQHGLHVQYACKGISASFRPWCLHACGVP